MIHCNRFTNSHLANRDNWQNGRRVTFSSMTNCVIENYLQETYSIKYVLKGTEHYLINGKKHSVRAGEFLVANKKLPMDTIIQSSKAVLGFCIHLDAAQVQQAYAAAVLPQHKLLDDPEQVAPVPEMESLIYAAGENPLGLYLHQLSAQFEAGEAVLAAHEEEFYQTVAAQMVALQNSRRIDGKLATRNQVEQELVARLQKAKAVMDDEGAEDLAVAQLAKQAMLSEAHFFRLFRQAYGISPYQYILRRKLQRAHLLLLKGKTTVTEAALHTGFADVATFSKAYKKQYGLSPGKMAGT